MSKKQIGIIGALCVILGVAAFFVTPLFAKKAPQAVATGEATLAANRVYVMYVDSCPMCKKALEYLDKNEAANPFIERVDLNTENGRALLNACRQKFGFKDVVIPLICADKEYSMGWSGSVGEQIKEWSQNAAAVY